MQNKQLRPYQLKGVQRMADIAKERDVLLADEPGLGKTIQVAEFVNQTRPTSVLIVCPASLRINWGKELEAWLTHKPGALDIASYGTAAKASDNLIHKWDLVVFDEAHYLKNPDAIRTKTCLKIPAHRRLFLTGTPIVNRPIDLWPILESMGTKIKKADYGREFCDGHIELVPITREKFNTLKRCHIRGAIEKDGRCYRQVWDFSGASNTDRLGRILRETCMVRRTKADVLTDLPAKVRQIIELPGQYKESVAMRAKIFQSFNEASDSLDTLFKVAFTEMSSLRLEQGLAKVGKVRDFMLDLLEEEEKIVLFAHHREVIDTLCDALQEAGIDTVKLYGGMTPRQKDASVRAFQTGHTRVFVGQISTAGVGLTLTAASTVVFAELDWVPGNVIQAEDRCHRLGQKKTVRVIHLVYKDSIDSRLVHALVRKQNTIQEVMQNAKS